MEDLQNTGSSVAGGGVTVPGEMSVAVYRGEGKVRVEQRPVPRPGPGEVLAEVSYCGICGSDLHLMVEGWGKPGLVAGHEWSGVVRELGEGVTLWSEGDVVVGGPSPRCGHCRRCLEEKPSQCEHRGQMAVVDVHDGAFAQFVVSGEAGLVGVGPGIGVREAALAEPLAVALHGITRSGARPGDRAMVFGAGPIGALTVSALLARGIGPVSVVEPHPGRRALAISLGAEVALDPSELESYPRWEPERLVSGAVDVVLECSGKKAATQLGLHQLRRGGVLVMVGAGIEAPELDPNRMILNELTVTGSFVYDADGFERALELLGSGKIPLHLLVEPSDVALDELGDALHGLASGAVAAKVLVCPGSEPKR